MPGEAEPRRFLIATATAHYKNEPAWNRPSLVQARQEVIDLFTGYLGYQHVTELGLNPTQGQLTERLREFCRSAELREDDMVAVYLAGHGEVLEEEHGGGHVFFTHDTDPDDLGDALSAEQLARKMLLGTRVRRALLMLDTCYSGQGGHELVSAALERIQHTWSSTPGSGLVIVSSSQPMEQAETGRFPQLLREAVEDLATAGHAPAALPLDAVVGRMNRDASRQWVGLTLTGLTGTVPPFLPNPRHQPHLREVDVAMQQDLLWQEQADRRHVELQSRLLVRAQGYQGISGSGWWFTGRRSALQALAFWLERVPEELGRENVLAVTAGPGSGKTAVLGVLAALAHPEVRRTVPVYSLDLPPSVPAAACRIDVAIYAQSLSDQQVLDGIAATIRVEARDAADLLHALEGRAEPLTVLIDGLDEAATPDSLCNTMLYPLISHGRGRIRLLLGTRPHLLPRLGLARDQHLDLDSEQFADWEAVAAYAARNLVYSHPDSPYRGGEGGLALDHYAHAVARAATPSFLVARIVAGTLAANPELPDPFDPGWVASLPRRADQAMAEDLRQRLGSDAERALDLLVPLAYAEGQGLPWEDLWASITTATSGHAYSDEDLYWLRAHAGSYIVEAEEDGRSAYRLYHQALAEHLRTLRDDQAVHAAIARTLTDHVPMRADGFDWSLAHPYTLRHLATHAARGGTLDEALADSEYLVHAESGPLLAQLVHAQTPVAKLAAAVYRTSLDRHRHASTDQRRRILAIDAARFNASGLLHVLNRHTRPDSWMPRWATGGGVSPALLNAIAGHVGAIDAVACSVLDGRPVAVTGGRDATMRVWDLATGRQIGQPLTGHNSRVYAAACSVLDDRSIAVTSSGDSTVRVWDLATGQQIGEPLTGHVGAVYAVACTVLDGRPIAVTGGRDGTVRVWDLATGQQIGEPLTGDSSPVNAVACTVLDGRSIAVAGGNEATLRIWDLATGQQTIQPLTGHSSRIYAVACTVLDGRPIGVSSGGDSTVRVWDLATGQQIGQPLTGHLGRVYAVACSDLDGRPIAVSGCRDESVRVWDLATSQQIGEPLTGDSSPVNAVACTVLDGRSIAVTGGDDATVRIWDLATSQQIGQPQPLTGHASRVYAVACTVLDGRSIAVAGGRDGTVRVWDLATGQQIGQPLTGHASPVYAVACTVLDGHSIAVTGGRDGTVRVWDLATGRQIGQPLTGHNSPVNAVACMVLDGRSIAVTGSHDATVRIWDLATRNCTDVLPVPASALATSPYGLVVAYARSIVFFQRKNESR